jgi:plasmid segregation protein ParM
VLLDEQAQFRVETAGLVEGQVAVLDIGMFTTDLILVNGLEYIEARSDTIEVGVSTAIEMLRKVLLDDHRITCESHELEAAMRRGWLMINGRRHPLNGLVSERFDPIARAIESKVRTLWNLGTLSAVILAGGGALALRPWLEPRFTQAIYAPNAAMANAEGFLRYGLRQWG